MNQREFDKFMKWLTRQLWWLTKGFFLLMGLLFSSLWELGTDFMNRAETKFGIFIRILAIILPLWIISFSGWFLATYWQTIAIEWLPTAMCIYKPKICAENQIKEAMVQDILQKAASGQLFVPIINSAPEIENTSSQGEGILGWFIKAASSMGRSMFESVQVPNLPQK